MTAVYSLLCQFPGLRTFLCAVFPTKFRVAGSETSEQTAKINLGNTSNLIISTARSTFLQRQLTVLQYKMFVGKVFVPPSPIFAYGLARTSAREGARIRKSSAILLAFRISLQTEFPNAHPFSFFSLLIGVQVSPIRLLIPHAYRDCHLYFYCRGRYKSRSERHYCMICHERLPLRSSLLARQPVASRTTASTLPQNGPSTEEGLSCNSKTG
jgi:hypothetical protein